jgi:hypothetical protein
MDLSDASKGSIPRVSAGSDGYGLGAAELPAAGRDEGSRADLVTSILCVWFTIGLFLDAWAHNNVSRLESFFTPWHAVFYSGFAATAGWLVWTVRDELLATRGWSRALPTGYAGALLAVVGFAAAGVGDYLWHTGFGIEQDIGILFSPTHLGLITAMFVIVTTPLRTAWADPRLHADPGLRRLLPAVLGTALAAALVLLFAQYANALTYDADSIVFAMSNRDQEYTAWVMASMAVTTLILTLPLLCLARRWRLPPGSATALYACCGALSFAITGFTNTTMILALIVAGIGVDVLGHRLRPGPGRSAPTRAFAALAPLLTWAVLLTVAHATAGPLQAGPGLLIGHRDSTLELILGTPLVQALIGLLAAGLLQLEWPPREPSPPRDPTAETAGQDKRVRRR